MKLRNYQEDVVLNAITIALEEREDLEKNDIFIKDVAAYVLNRLPPRYIMSERGFIRLASEFYEENKKTLVNAIELMFLVNKGIDVVTKRPRFDVVQPDQKREAADLQDNDSGLLHSFPQILGRVLTNKEKKYLADARVRLYIDGELSEPAEPTWENPYITREQTKGFFSFWPKPFYSPEKKVVHSIKIEIEHPDFEQGTIETTVETYSYLNGNSELGEESIKYISPVLLKRK
jgi:competence protein ComFB